MLKITLISLIFLGTIHSYANEKIILGAADWCPYTCPETSDNGFVTKFIKNILLQHDIELEVKFLPWKRAVKMAESGELNGLVTVVQSEAPQLKFTSFPTTTYKSCIFSTNSKSKELTKEEVKTKKIGIISGYSYGKEIDAILSGMKKNLTVIYGTNELHRLKNLIQANRIEYFAEDYKVARHKFGNKVKAVFCGEENNVYLAVNNKKQINQRVLQILNNELKFKQAKLLVFNWMAGLTTY